MRIDASAPLRADLAGGTIDIWPLCLLHGGASTVNVALRLRARATYEARGDAWELRAGDHGARRRVSPARLEQARDAVGQGDPFALVLRALGWFRPQRPGRLTTIVEGPPGGGIGGSSALLIALLGLAARVAGQSLRRETLADLARDLESQVLGLPTGVQDYHPAIRGGVLQLHYGPGGTRVERLRVDPRMVAERLVLAYSGRAHASAPSNWGLIRRRLDGEERAVRCFADIARAASLAGDALRQGDWRALGKAMTMDWEARRRLDPALSPEDLERLERAGLGAGAAAAKGCGAASGGCMLFLLRRPADRRAVEEALRAAEATLLDMGVSGSGLSVRRRSTGRKRDS